MSSRSCRKSYAANPHYYDYLHSFTLVPDENGTTGTIEMADGGGQCINFEDTGKYQWFWDDCEHVRGRLSVTDLADSNDFEVSFVVERGTFCLEKGWGTCHLDVKYLVAKKRYVFDRDPLSACLESRNTNLMFLLEGNELDTDRRTYYDSFETKTRQKLIEEKIKFTDDGYYIFKYDPYSRVSIELFVKDVLTLNSDSKLPTLLRSIKNYSIFGLYKENDGSLAGYVVCVFRVAEFVSKSEKIFRGVWVPEMVVPDTKLQRSLQWIQHEMYQANADVLLFENPSEKVREILTVAEPCDRECKMRRACKNLISCDDLCQNLHFLVEIDATKCKVFSPREESRTV